MKRVCAVCAAKTKTLISCAPLFLHMNVVGFLMLQLRLILLYILTFFPHYKTDHTKIVSNDELLFRLQYAEPVVESIEIIMSPACRYGTQNVNNKCGKLF